MTQASPPSLPLSELIRVNEIGAGLSRTLEPDQAGRARIAKALDLASLEAFQADVTVAPAREGWTLSGRVTATAEQTCGITLEPLPVTIDERFSINLIEATTRKDDGADDEEIEVSLDDDAPDVIEDGRIDLGQYAVEQLALALDPFPRKPGAEFVQPEEPAEISPFAVLKACRAPPEDGHG